MSAPLRIFLIICAATVQYFIIKNLKKAKFEVMDSIFWLFLAANFVLLAVFPQIAFFIAGLLGFESPSNFVFLYIIAILVVRDFSNTTKISRLNRRINALIQEVALKDK